MVCVMHISTEVALLQYVETVHIYLGVIDENFTHQAGNAQRNSDIKT